MPEYKGSCLCGTIQYKYNDASLFSGICHCTSCQKSSGSAFSTFIGIKKANFEMTGNSLKKYECIGESGNTIARHFCANCGSTIFGESISFPNVILLKAGTLDDQSLFEPQMNVYWRDNCSWLSKIHEKPIYETNPSPKGNKNQK